jgi:hypothetical protein
MRVSGGVSAGLGLVVAVCLGTGLLAAGGVVGADEPPVADAGLDQAVERNATVYLDAGGSYDPDGEVAGYNWSVVAPNGTEFEPDCVTCERTSFRAAQTGQYNVTVTATDGTGMRTSDTVYVTVEEPDPPELQLTGPESLFVGSDGTASADVTAGDDPVSRLVWSVDGSEVGTEELTGSGTRERMLSFGEAGTHTVTAAVTDVLGRTVTDTHTVEVVETSPSSGSSAPSAAGGGGGDSPDASTDFVVANSDLILDYSDLSFNNYADGDSAITLDNTAGPGEITLVSQEEAQEHFEPYNWHNVNLGDLIEDNLVTKSQADKIFERARENRDKHGSGAVGGINPYESDVTREPPNLPGGMDSLTPPPSRPTDTSDPVVRNEAGPPSSETVTITSGSKMADSEAEGISDPTEGRTDNPGIETAPASNSDSSEADTNNPKRGQDTVTIV